MTWKSFKTFKKVSTTNAKQYIMSLYFQKIPQLSILAIFFVSLGSGNVKLLKVFRLKHTKNAEYWYKNAHWTLFLGYLRWKIRCKLFLGFRYPSLGLARIHSFKSYLYIQAGNDSIDNRNNHRSSFFWYLDTRHRSLILGNLKKRWFQVGSS